MEDLLLAALCAGVALACAAFGAELPRGSRAGIADRLAALAREPAPTDLSRGAMCYAPMPEPPRVEYLCPACGERTVYPASGEGYYACLRIDACRRLVGEIRGLDVRLDESEFCAKCRPGTISPRLTLVLKVPGARARRIAKFREEDLVLLAEFTTGSSRHDGGPGGETPLKDHLPRLVTLLGVKPAGAD